MQVQHPQYVGSVATVLGAAVLVSLPAWQTPRAGPCPALRCPAPPPVLQPIVPLLVSSCRLQVWSQAPAGLGLLVGYWTALYVVTAFQESKLHLD